MLSFKRMSEVKDQLEWIANHNYDSYDSPTSQSNGSVAVYKADVEQLLNKVDWADKYDEVDTDGMQVLLIDEVVFLTRWSPTNQLSLSYRFTQVKTSVEFHIIDEIKKWVATSIARRIIR
jgi:hypothetical protein